MSKRNTSSTEGPLEYPEDSDNGILEEVLRRYKTVVFPPDDHSDVDAATLDRLMAATSDMRSSIVGRRPTTLRFPRLSWMAAAASFMVLFGVAVLFWPERSKPDLVVVNALPLDSMLFAMRGGETNDIMDAGRAVSFVHEIAVKQSGRPVPVVVVTSGALTNKLSSALAGRASAGRGYFLVLTENSEVAGWIQLDIRDKTTGASKGKTQIRPISSVSETTDLIEQLLQKIMVSER